MPQTISVLQTKRFSRKKGAEVIDRAKQLGLSPKAYLTFLVEEDLAKCGTFPQPTLEQLLGPGEPVDEDKLDRLVDEAKARHRRRITRGK